MKKLIVLISIFFLLVAFTHAQDSEVIQVNLTANVVAGCYLSITPSNAVWSVSLPQSQAEVDTWLSNDGIPLDCFISYRLPNGSMMRLGQTSQSLLDWGDGYTLPLESYCKNVFTGDIIADLPLAVSGSTVEVYVSNTNAGTKISQIDLQLLNSSALKAGTATASIAYQAREW